MGALLRGAHIDGATEEVVSARRRGPGGERTCSDREPALLFGDERRVCELEALAAVAGRQVQQDRVRVGQGKLTVLEHGYLSEGVQRQEARRLLFLGGQVHVDGL